jgi:hypothetical protein
MSPNELAEALDKIKELWTAVDQRPPLSPERAFPLVGKAEVILTALIDEFRATMNR